jgi:hypothetical protein
VVTLIKFILAANVEDRRIAFEARRVERKPVEDVLDPSEAARRVFQRHAPYNSVHLVTEGQQMFGQVTAILTCDACDESSLGHG